MFDLSDTYLGGYTEGKKEDVTLLTLGDYIDMREDNLG